jgi:hypothetical protein
MNDTSLLREILMPAHKKALSPASRAKADKRNERERAARAAKAAASGGRKSGKKRKATPDLAEEEMPTSSGALGSFELLLEARKNMGRLEAEELALAEEKVAFYKRALGDSERNAERILGLNNAYVEYLEWADAEKTKRIEVLAKENLQIIQLEFDNKKLKEQIAAMKAGNSEAGSGDEMSGEEQADQQAEHFATA